MVTQYDCQALAPAVRCEMTQAGEHARLAARGGRRTFPPRAVFVSPYPYPVVLATSDCIRSSFASFPPQKSESRG
jgi:hypothetical protein